MILTILIILGVIIFFFLKDRDKSLENQVDFQGGIQNKYSLLIQYLSDHPYAKISKVTRDFVKIDCVMPTTSTTFEILQNFNNVEVLWNSDFGMMGKHKLKWTFPSSLPQNKMIEKISYDLNAYENKLY